MLNRCVIIGRVTRDIDLKYTNNGTAVTNFTLAVDRKFSKDETDFINVVVWKGQAESCANYLSKGKMAAVDGRLQIRNYETKEGQKRTIAEVVADNVRFLSPAAEKKPVENQQGERPWPGTDGDPVHVPDLDNDDDLPVYDEQDLPF